MNALKKFFAALLTVCLTATSLYAKVTIYLCGDSTMQDWKDGYYPKRGIGQEFSFFWNADAVTVVNKGVGGLYAKGFYEKYWSEILNNLRAGDFVILQFGINDRSYSNESEFREATTQMAKEALEKGATPIIVNPVRRSDFRYSSSALTVPDSIYESYHAYPIIAREIAASLNVPLIDIDTLSRNYLLSVGQFYALRFVNLYLNAGEYSTYQNGNSDNLHLQQNGAEVFGRIITEQMRVHPNADVRKLSESLAPMYALKVNVSPEGSDSATTISSYYPAGMTVTLKTIPQPGKTFLGWFDSEGNKISNSISSVQSEYICTMKMGAKSTGVTAVYGGGSFVPYTGSEAALTDFPKGTPKILEDIIPSAGNSGDSVSAFDKKIARWFDASVAPDSFDVGWSENTNAGFTGNGYWNFDNAVNTFADYRMEFPSAGYVTMGIIYANGGTSSRRLNVYLEHDYHVDFPSTGSWENWDTAWVNVDLAYGEETLRFISLTSDGGPNIDAFGFSIDGVLRKTTPSDSVKDSTLKISRKIAALDAGISLHGKTLVLNRAGRVSVRLFDLHGREVWRRSSEMVRGTSELPIPENLPAGIYRLVVRLGNETLNASWLELGK